MLEFDVDSHTYLYEGWKVLPSVSSLLKYVFPNKYANVPTQILNAKASYGTTLHKAIEIYETSLREMKPEEAFIEVMASLDLDDNQKDSFNQYLELKEKYNIEVIDSELMVSYKDKYAGCIDMVAKVNGELAIIDIKATYKLDKDYVSWQTSYYELAYDPVKRLYCLWLPKAKEGKLQEVKRIDKTSLLSVVDLVYNRDNQGDE